MNVRITIAAGMVQIAAEGLSFGFIPNMYTTGHGAGLQLNDELRRDKIEKMCVEISEQVMAFHDELIKEIK